jgi:hypothetical protein
MQLNKNQILEQLSKKKLDPVFTQNIVPWWGIFPMMP